MSPDECIASLDSALADDGEDIILRRVVGIAPNQANIDVKCRARVRSVRTEQILGNVTASSVNVIISPTQIADAQWPGGTSPRLPPFDVDPSVPSINTDKLIVGGRLLNLQAVNIIKIDGMLVRIEIIAG